MSAERRSSPRIPRMLELRFEWERETAVGVTIEISLSGAFLNTTVFPPQGAEVDFTYEAHRGHPTVVFRATVIRAVGPLSRVSVVPGIGIEWVRVATEGPANYLTRALRAIFDRDLLVAAPARGGAVWCPGPVIAGQGRRPGGDDVTTAVDSLPAPWAASTPIRVEQRQTARFPCSARVSLLAAPGAEPVPGHLTDIGLLGLRIVGTALAPKPGDVLSVRLPVAGREGARWMRLDAVVVRTFVDPVQGFAARIVGTGGPEGAAALERLPMSLK